MDNCGDSSIRCDDPHFPPFLCSVSKVPASSSPAADILTALDSACQESERTLFGPTKQELVPKILKDLNLKPEELATPNLVKLQFPKLYPYQREAFARLRAQRYGATLREYVLQRKGWCLAIKPAGGIQND